MGRGLIAAVLVSACGTASGGALGSPLRTATPPAGDIRPSPSSATAASGDWPAYHGGPTRAGEGDGPADPATVRLLWAAQVDGDVQASPVVAGGRVVVATEQDTVLALDPATGRQLWSTHLGTPVPESDLPCGNIFPLGITGTPVVDEATATVYVVAEVTGGEHDLVGLRLSDGATVARAAVDAPGTDRIAYQERGALALTAGRVIVAMGGLNGDCSDYRGYVVSAAEEDVTRQSVFTVPTTREGGIWAPPGPVVDGDGRILVAVGNGESTSDYDGSESVVALDPLMHETDFWAPADWSGLNATDADIGSTSPALLPGGLVAQGGKSGRLAVLRGSHLGGIGGELSSTPVCPGGVYGGSAVAGDVVLLPCVGGEQAVRVDAGGAVRALWTSEASGSPVVSGGVAWIPVQGRLDAVELATGRRLASVATPEVFRFTTPALAGGRIFEGAHGVVRALGDQPVTAAARAQPAGTSWRTAAGCRIRI